MHDFKEEYYKVFEMFDKQWALVTAGTNENFNSCTISWGSLGNMWGNGTNSYPTCTIYIHPTRYTSEFLLAYDTFTVSFFSTNYHKALAYLGSCSGRDIDKINKSGLTPIKMGDSITFKEAKITFLCHKLYQHQFAKNDLDDKIKQYYASKPSIFSDFNGGWQPHIIFIGEIIAVDRRDGDIQ